MQFLWLYIDELVGKGLSLLIVAEFLMWGSFTILPLALPLATLLSAMMTMGQLGEFSELTAMKASGLSLTRILSPLIVSAVLISVGAFYASNNLVPYAYNKIYTLRDDIGKTKEEIKIPAGTFYDGIDGYVLRVESTDESTGMMYGVMVYDHTRTGANNNLALADSATMKMSKNKDYLTFTLFNGTSYQDNQGTEDGKTFRELSRVSFDRQDLIIELTNYAFEKSDEERFGDVVKSMNLKQLRVEHDTLTTRTSAKHESHSATIYEAPALRRGRQFDTAFIAKNPEIFYHENYMVWETPRQEIDALKAASHKALELASMLTEFSRDSYNDYYNLRRTDLEILKKFSGALACLLLFFIGAPLGALIRKGGLGTPAIISVLFFVLYWVVDITGNKLAKDGAMDTFTGSFISAYVLAPIGAYLTWKAIHDSPIFNTDSFKSWWNKLKSKIMNRNKKTRIVFMGTPEFAVASLDALITSGYNVVGVVTVADKPSGRGLKMNESAVKKYAVEHNLPILQPVKLKDPDFLESLKAWKADLFVVVAFRMLPEEVWNMPRMGSFNLHAALLPQYRGAAPINWAVINGENITGVTTFKIDKDIDTGVIYLRNSYKIKDTDTAGDVHDNLMSIGAKLVTQTVEGLIEENIETRVQRSFIQGAEVLKPAPKLNRELCRINWNEKSSTIYNLIRGLSPYPTAFTELDYGEGKIEQLKIFFGEIIEKENGVAPGTIFSDGKTYLAIATANGAISIKDLQLQGKKRMDIRSFLLGFRDYDKVKIIV